MNTMMIVSRIAMTTMTMTIYLACSTSASGGNQADGFAPALVVASLELGGKQETTQLWF